jgi:hypothetical protein
VRKIQRDLNIYSHVVRQLLTGIRQFGPIFGLLHLYVQ